MFSLIFGHRDSFCKKFSQVSDAGCAVVVGRYGIGDQSRVRVRVHHSYDWDEHLGRVLDGDVGIEAMVVGVQKHDHVGQADHALKLNRRVSQHAALQEIV